MLARAVPVWADIDAEAAAQAAAREEAEAVKEEEPPWQPVPEDSFPKLEQLARSNACLLYTSPSPRD